MTDFQSRLQAAIGTNYRIERELGGGGMSRVFVAHEVELARRVVVKVLPPDMAAGLNAERFRREIQLAASLQHPHIVPLISSGRSGDLVWYTMPFIEGESLRARLARERELPIPDAVRILRDVSDALAYAHDHGVVHRDIKPDNILLTGRHAVVMDFGVAKAVSASTGESSLTSIGVALGTPAYMSPEQASADPNVDHRADIYCLGATAYEMLSGHPPFSGAPQMVLAAHVTQAPEPVTNRRASVPPALATIIMRALEKKPADRWQSASELHEQFELMATPSGGAQPTSATMATTAKRTAVPARLPLIAGGLLAAALVIAAAVRFWPASSDRGSMLDPRVVAILPFRVAGADPSLHYLRQGMLDLLQTKLTGEGGPRAADARSLLAAFRDAGGTDSDDVPEAGVVAIARKLGAGRVVQGSIVGPPNHVVLAASLIEMPSARPVAQTSVEGPKDSLFAMVDRLAAQLLALGAGATTQQLSSLTTTSLDALRAYLDGVVAGRHGNFVTATPLLTRAVQLDSTFALALSALLEANGWVPSSTDMNRVRRLAWQYRDRLSAKDQLMLSIRLGSRYPEETPYTEQIADRIKATQQMPDNAEAWYHLGDGLFHWGRASDFPDAMSRAQDAFLRAFQLDSLFAPPAIHMASIKIVTGDTAGAALWVRRELALDSTDVAIGKTFHWVMATMRRDASQLKVSLAELGPVPTVGQYLIQYFPFDSTAIANRDAVLAADLRHASSPTDRVASIRRRVRVLENQGRPGEGRMWLDSLRVNGEPVATTAVFAVFGGALYSGDTTGVEAAAQKLSDSPEGAFAREMWRASQGNTASVSKTVAAIRKAQVDPSSQDVLRMAIVLEAWGAARGGAPRATVERLAATADSAARGITIRAEVFAIILARIYEELGAFDRALVAIRRRNVPLGFPSLSGLAEAMRMEGRLAAKAGDTAGAIRAYERYLLLRMDPEPSKMPQRDSVAAELAAIKKKP